MNIQYAKLLVLSAILFAERTVDPWLAPIAGMTSPKFRRFLNSLCENDGPYLEVGPYLGATICAAMEGNEGPFYAIDNFCEFNPSGENEKIFWENVGKVKDKSGPLTFINQDCFTVDLGRFPKKFPIYFYDGRHLEIDQYRALTHFIPVMEDVFIYLVDDWLALPGLSDGVREATFKAIKDLGLTTHLHVALGSTKRDDMEEWGCGCGVFVLSKP